MCFPCCFRASLFKKIGARLLPSIACLKRISPLSFMPLVPYPARFARHLPLEGKGDRTAVDRVLSQTAHLRRSFPLFFIPLPSSNLRPFGAPPSIGRRECPREPLPLEGAAERSEAGLVSFWGGEAPSSLPFPSGKGVVSRKALSSYRSLPLCRRLFISSGEATTTSLKTGMRD